MSAFNPIIETEVKSRPPGPAPMQDNSSAIALGGITQAVRILGSKFGGTRGNTGPSKADQTTANNKGFMQAVDKIQAMRDQGASTQQIQITQQKVLKNAIDAGIDLGDSSLNKTYKMVTGRELEDFGTSLADRALAGQEMTEQEQRNLVLQSREGMTQEQADAKIAAVDGTLANFEQAQKLKKAQTTADFTTFFDVSGRRAADAIYNEVFGALGLGSTKQEGKFQFVDMSQKMTKDEAIALKGRIEIIQANYDQLAAGADLEDPMVKSYSDYGKKVFKAATGLLDLASLEVQEESAKQNQNNLMKAAVNYLNTNVDDKGNPILSDDIPEGQVAMLFAFGANSADLSLMASNGDFGKLMENYGAVVRTMDKLKTGKPEPTNVATEMQEIADGAKIGETSAYRKGPKGQKPMEVIDDAIYYGTWASFVNADLMKSAPEVKEGYINTVANLAHTMSTSEGFMSDKFIKSVFPSDNMLNNLNILDKENPETANFVREKVRYGLMKQKGAAQDNIDNQLAASKFQYEFDEEKGKWYIDKDTLSKGMVPWWDKNQSTLFAKEGYELTESKLRLYVPDDHTPTLENIQKAIKTKKHIEALEADWSPETEGDVRVEYPAISADEFERLRPSMSPEAVEHYSELSDQGMLRDNTFVEGADKVLSGVIPEDSTIGKLAAADTEEKDKGLLDEITGAESKAAELTGDDNATPDQTDDVVKEDLPPAGPAEAEVPATAEDESGVPTPADRPEDLSSLGLEPKSAEVLTKAQVTQEDDPVQALQKLTDAGAPPKDALAAITELVAKKDALLAKRESEMATATEQPVSAKGTSATDVTSGTTQEAEIFDFITQAEGTKKTDDPYSTTLGYGAFIKGGERDLTKVPLGEIDRLQTEILNNPKNKTGGSPVGKYQVVQRTLRDAKKALGLKDTDLFTKEVQDKVGMWLLNRRGYQDWKDGKISDAQFTKNMQNEWHALKVKPEFMKQILATKGHKGQAAPKGLSALSPSFQPTLSKADQPLVTRGSGDASRMVKQGSFKRLDKVLQGPYQSAFVKFREKFGKDLVINDAIAKAGTSREKKRPGSRHFHGDALDISTRGMSNKEKLELFKILKGSGFKGFGFGATIIHADMGSKRAWSYDNETYGDVRVSKLIAEAKS
jgi:muramidase (phage lysozyme)